MGARTRRAPIVCAIRPATPDDAESVVVMVNAAYARSEAHVFARTERTGRTSRSNFAKDIDAIFVAEHDGAIRGCIHVITADEPAHFGLLATDVAFQGDGIASQLIAHAERLARDARRNVMKIETVREAGLRGFYEAHGYQVVRETEGQVWNGGADGGAVIDWHMLDMEKILP